MRSLFVPIISRAHEWSLKITSPNFIPIYQIPTHTSSQKPPNLTSFRAFASRTPFRMYRSAALYDAMDEPDPEKTMWRRGVMLKRQTIISRETFLNVPNLTKYLQRKHGIHFMIGPRTFGKGMESNLEIWVPRFLRNDECRRYLWNPQLALGDSPRGIYADFYQRCR